MLTPPNIGDTVVYIGATDLYRVNGLIYRVVKSQCYNGKVGIELNREGLSSVLCTDYALLEPTGRGEEGTLTDTRPEGRISQGRFTTKDSGERASFASGMVRDTNKGKARFDLLLAEGISYGNQFLTRVAELFARGAEKYADRNWEQANSTEELARMKESAFRHFIQWMSGEEDEDHAAAVVFNLLAYESTITKLTEGDDA